MFGNQRPPPPKRALPSTKQTAPCSDKAVVGCSGKGKAVLDFPSPGPPDYGVGESCSFRKLEIGQWPPYKTKRRMTAGAGTCAGRSRPTVRPHRKLLTSPHRDGAWPRRTVQSRWPQREAGLALAGLAQTPPPTRHRRARSAPLDQSRDGPRVKGVELRGVEGLQSKRGGGKAVWRSNALATGSGSYWAAI